MYHSACLEANNMWYTFLVIWKLGEWDFQIELLHKMNQYFACTVIVTVAVLIFELSKTAVGVGTAQRLREL